MTPRGLLMLPPEEPGGIASGVEPEMPKSCTTADTEPSATPPARNPNSGVNR